MEVFLGYQILRYMFSCSMEFGTHPSAYPFTGTASFVINNSFSSHVSLCNGNCILSALLCCAFPPQTPKQLKHQATTWCPPSGCFLQQGHMLLLHLPYLCRFLAVSSCPVRYFTLSLFFVPSVIPLTVTQVSMYLSALQGSAVCMPLKSIVEVSAFPRRSSE